MVLCGLCSEHFGKKPAVHFYYLPENPQFGDISLLARCEDHVSPFADSEFISIKEDEFVVFSIMSV